MSRADDPLKPPTGDSIAPLPAAQPAVVTPPAAQPKVAKPAKVRPGVVVPPPPPPPRSTLPPVRPPAAPVAVSSVGSARMGRWRGEFDSVGSGSIAGNANLAAEAESTLPAATDRVTRSAPPWLVSMVIHLVVLLILALLTTPVGDRLGRIVWNAGQVAQSDSVALAEFSISSNDFEIESDSEADSIVPVDLPSAFDAIDLAFNDAPVPIDVGLGSLASADVRPMFGGRSGAMKDALLKIYGGTPETRNAVKEGLEWLRRNQNKRGGWSMKGPYRDGSHSENDTAATAMALLAFLGDGHTHKAGDYQLVVEKGMKYLIKLQDRSGFFAQKARNHERMYAQAQATIAICEMYGMTGDSWLRPYAQSAIDFAHESQSPQGGWRYQPKQDSDTSVTGWFVMALESGRTAGLEVHESKLRHVSDYLDTAQHFGGAAYSYQQGGSPTAPMTAEGLLCRQYLGWLRSNKSLVLGIEALLENDPFDIKQRDVYYWYYATQVLHHFGGSPWQRWNEKMRDQLPAAQISTGKENGSWAPQMDEYGNFYGRLYTTCLSIYCLEVYYRHMPLYQLEVQAQQELSMSN